MAILLDTRVLLWAVYEPERLSRGVCDTLEDPASEVWFSAVSIYEIALKQSLDTPDFTASPYAVRAEALSLGFRELPLDGIQAALVITLPPLDVDPFERLLLAQAQATGHILWTSDAWAESFMGPVQPVRQARSPRLRLAATPTARTAVRR